MIILHLCAKNLDDIIYNSRVSHTEIGNYGSFLTLLPHLLKNQKNQNFEKIKKTKKKIKKIAGDIIYAYVPKSAIL